MTENIERLEDYGLSKDNKPKTLISWTEYCKNDKFQRIGCGISGG